jgi:hypothetical protein
VNALRRLSAVTLIGMGALLSMHFAIQPEPGYSPCTQNSSHYTCGHTVDISRLFSNTQNYCHAQSNHGFCASLNAHPDKDGILQLIDSEDEEALALPQNKLEEKVSSAGNVSAHHYAGKVLVSRLPLYLLQSSFLL